jgi:ABC-2 type transport system permease protein
VAVAYLVFGAFIVLVALFAHPGVASALMRGSDVLAQLIFTPLVAGWSIWLGTGISTRASDIRVAQQVSMLASLPTIAVTTLIALDVIHATLTVALACGAGLLVANLRGWRFVSALFDRERLITR